MTRRHRIWAAAGCAVVLLGVLACTSGTHRDRPGPGPAQAGPGLGSALPTNQWWTSALTGPLSQPIWAHPLAVRVTADGIQVSSAPPTATPNAVVTPFVPAVTVPGPVRGLHVV